MGYLEFLEIKSELGAGTRGSSLGVNAIKIADVESGGKLFDEHRSTSIESGINALNDEVDTKYARRIELIAPLYEEISNATADILEANGFPLVIAGDHSNAGGTVAGIKKAYPEKRLGVIWIDAHADLHSPFTTPSGNVHGMPMAAILGIDNISEQQNESVDELTISCWEALKQAGGVSPKVNPEDVVFIAVRDTEEQEDSVINEMQIRSFSVESVRNDGAETVARETLSYLSKCDLIYVSFDVDSLDPEVSVGTGTPVPGGLFEDEANRLLNTLLAEEKVVCCEFVEVNPLLDTKNKMAQVAYRLIKDAVTKIKERKSEDVTG